MRTAPLEERAAIVRGPYYRELIRLEVRAIKNQLLRIAGLPVGRAYLSTVVGDDGAISIEVKYRVESRDECAWARRVVDGFPLEWDDVARKYLRENGYFTILGYNLDLRVCDGCQGIMEEGYVIEGGEKYYCGIECRRGGMKDSEYDKLIDDGTDTYWTVFDE